MLKNIISSVVTMYESDKFWISNNPYSSGEQLHGRRTDEELRKLISSKLKNIPRLDTSKVAVNVVDHVVSLTGSVKTFEDKRGVGEEAWKIEGVVKVLNGLRVIEPSTAGPTRRD
jgi:osmotically-inducible protein OsmY